MYVKAGNLRALRHDYVINSFRNTCYFRSEKRILALGRGSGWAPLNPFHPTYDISF